MQIFHARADVGCHHVAHEILAGAGSGNRAAIVTGIGSGADDGRIADASRHLQNSAAGGGASGEITGLIQRDYAHRPMSVSGFLLLLGVLESIPLTFRVEVIWRDQ